MSNLYPATPEWIENARDFINTNLVQNESQDVKHKFGLDKYPDISTEGLIVAARTILKSMAMEPPSHCRCTDIQYMALEYWAEICVTSWYENKGSH